MRPALLSLVLCMLAMLGAFAQAADAPYRTFTDREGREIRAVIIRTGPEMVWIRRDDGRTFRVSRSIFSESDRKYISRWEISDALQRPDALEFTASRFADGPPDTILTESRRNIIQKFGYEITLTNNTGRELEDLEIHYRYYVWDAQKLAQEGQNRRIISHGGKVKIELLPAYGTETFKTSSASLKSTELRSGWYNKTTNNRSTGDDLRGVWIKIFQNGVLLTEFSSPSAVKETERW